MKEFSRVLKQNSNLAFSTGRALGQKFPMIESRHLTTLSDHKQKDDSKHEKYRFWQENIKVIGVGAGIAAASWIFFKNEKIKSERKLLENARSAISELDKAASDLSIYRNKIAIFHTDDYKLSEDFINMWKKDGPKEVDLIVNSLFRSVLYQDPKIVNESFREKMSVIQKDLKSAIQKMYVEVGDFETANTILESSITKISGTSATYGKRVAELKLISTKLKTLIEISQEHIRNNILAIQHNLSAPNSSEDLNLEDHGTVGKYFKDLRPETVNQKDL